MVLALAASSFVGGARASDAATGCPSLNGKQASTDISAYFNDNGGGNATYFIDTPNDSPSAGVPGLIKYCVFTSPSPDSAAADYAGWTSAIGSGDFAFGRPNGTSNIPFDGTTGVDVGNATWTSGTVPAPADQTILLHIADPSECTALYGGNPGTCWVLPNGTPPTPPATDLSVSKTANASYTNTYSWDVSKSVDKTRVEQVGGSATFNYTLTAAWSGPVPSAWAVTGDITVSNPNDYDFTGVDVTDAIDNGGSCTVSAGSPGSVDPTSATIPGNGSIDFPYSCSYGSAPSPAAGTNTATATWDPQTNGTTDSSAKGTAGVDFSTVTPTVVNGTSTITDTFAGTPTTLGVAGVDGSWTKDAGNTLTSFHESYSAPTFTFTYSRAILVPASGCQNYTNTASESTGTDPTTPDSVTVTVCGPAHTGALTMGFWQNKNGQGIITSSGPSTGTCTLTPWLLQFAPFQGGVLATNATCAQVATYVYNVIKAATCSGPSASPCNAMLKAQDLATTLDVYFSDPGLGGNRINAPAPIGGVQIDLTKICNMIDGSGGTATCSGVFTSASSVFGGNACLYVYKLSELTDILRYAASQASAGGIPWYGTNKSNQVLAKNVFDAINNQVAFSC
jgi:hypothetical protein